MSVPVAPHAASQDHYCFIIHDAIPYCYDLNSILALPTGFRYRNRFNSPWVEPNLRGDVGSMEESRVLIILRDLTRNRLVPTRGATIKMAVRIGQIYYFEYLLGNLVKYSEEEDHREQQITDMTARFGRFHNWLPGTPGVALDAQQPSVFRSAAGLDLQSASDADLDGRALFNRSGT